MDTNIEVNHENHEKHERIQNHEWTLMDTNIEVNHENHEWTRKNTEPRIDTNGHEY